MLFSRSKLEMVTPEQALPGRDEAMPTEPHHVLGGAVTPPWPEGARTAVVAMGCFWGAERVFWQLPGVITTAVGYAGGYTPHPTYQEVCTGQTGHTEAVLVVYDPDVVAYEDLLKAFWENHDPTQQMRQGNDVGTQYRSAVFVGDDAQRAAAEASRDRYQARLRDEGYGDIATEILPVSAPAATPPDAGAGEFYYAEPAHQQYLAKNPGGYCNHGFCQVAYA